MTVRIAFTSCSDPMDKPEQPVWDLIADQQPDHLVLLGDQIYMDFGMWFVHSENPPLGRPAKMTNLDFANAMHLRYSRQWDIVRRSRLALLPKLCIHGIWDDHDFAWNNSYGDSGSNDAHGPAHKRDPVSRDKQRISRSLMRDFFAALHDFEHAYPANGATGDPPAPGEVLSTPMVCASPRSEFDAGRINLPHQARLLLTDGRSFRTRPNASPSTVFGEAQWRWLEAQVDDGALVVLASSTTLDEGGEHLDHYPDYDRMRALAELRQARMVCWSGDVHKLDWRHHGPRVYEAVASGAAREPFGQEGAFGVMEIDDEQVSISLHLASAVPKLRRTVERASWQER